MFWEVVHVFPIEPLQWIVDTTDDTPLSLPLQASHPTQDDKVAHLDQGGRGLHGPGHACLARYHASRANRPTRHRSRYREEPRTKRLTELGVDYFAELWAGF
jgi:hypothetical protein